jgi:hypothetical protein
LISEGKLPVSSRDRFGRTLLHHAVIHNRKKVIVFLTTNSDIIDPYDIQFLLECKGGKSSWKTPVEFAAVVGNANLVNYFLELPIFPMLDEFGRIFRRLLMRNTYSSIIYRVMYALIRYDLRTVISRKLAETTITLAKLKMWCESLYWWEGRRNLMISFEDKSVIFCDIVNLGCAGNVAVMDYLIKELDINLQKLPYSGFQNLLSYPDHIVMDSSSRFQCIPFGDKRITCLYSLKNPQDSVVEAFRGLAHFSEFWDGNIESLGSSMKSAATKYKEEHYIENVFMSTCESGYDEKTIRTLEYFSNLYFELKSTVDINFANYFPRIDLIVINWQVNMFNWLLDKKYIKLNEEITLLDNLNAIVSEGENNNSIFENGEDDPDQEECAVCFLEKKCPQQLDCGHSFCISCTRRVFITNDSLGKQKCPLCRALMDPPLQFSFVSTLLFYSPEFAPWVNDYFSESESFSVAKYILSLAAGSDSISIFAKVLQEMSDINLNELVYKDGNNIMHIVCQNGSLLTFIWLIKNGYRSLMDKKRDDGLIPIQVLMNSNLYGSWYVFIYAKGRSLLPAEWFLYGVSCKNELIMNSAQMKLEFIETKKFLLPENFKQADIKEIEEVYKSAPFSMMCLSEEEPNGLSFIEKTLIPSGRMDAFQLFCSAFQDKGFQYIKFESLKKLIPIDHENAEQHFAIISEVERTSKLRSELWDLYTAFLAIMKEERPALEIDSLIEKQNEVCKELGAKLSKDEPMINLMDLYNENDTDALTIALKTERFELASRLLERNEFKENIQLFEKVIEHSYNFKSMRLILDHMEKLGASSRSCIITALKRSVKLIHFIGSYKKEGWEEDNRNLFDFILYCMKKSNIDISNEKFDNDEPFVYFFFSSLENIYIGKELEQAYEFFSTTALHFLRCFIDLGFDPNARVYPKLSFIQILLRKNQSFCLPCIHYLAFEKGVSLQNITKNECRWEEKYAKEIFAMIKEQKRMLENNMMIQ